MRLMTLFLKYKSTSIITIFVVLIVGNIMPVYSIDNHTKHDTPPLSMQNQQNANIEEQDVSVNKPSKSYAEQIVASCQDDGDHCPMMTLDELNKTESRQLVLGTFSDLVRLYDENNYTCHHEGHHLGMWLNDYTRNLTEALKYATILCGGSVYHGIFQSYFEGEQLVQNVDKDQILITNLCPIGQENVSWLHERDCFHGIGHGLVKLYNYDTAAAVDRCNEFVPLWAQSACSRGVFMEYYEYFFETGNGDFDANDIYSPCNRTVEKFAPQCYYYYPAYKLVGNNLTIQHNLTDAFANCDNISPGKFAKYCYQGIGRLLSPNAYTDPEYSIAACYSGNQPAYNYDCLLGTLKTILKGDGKTDAGFQFCSVSKSVFKATCYEILGMWIKTFLNLNQQELETECAKTHDGDYVFNCMNPNPETGVDVPIFEPI